MKKIIIYLKIAGPLLIICATYIATVTIVNIDKRISKVREEISNFHDARILVMQAVLSYEGRDTLFAVHDTQYYQMLNYLRDLKKEPDGNEKNKKEIDALEKVIKITEETALDNSIFLTILRSTLLSKDEKSEQETRNITSKIRNNKNLTKTEKIEKIRKIQDKNQKVFGERFAEIQKKWQDNISSEKRLTNGRLFWYRVFAWMQIVGLSMLAIAGAIKGMLKLKKKANGEQGGVMGFIKSNVDTLKKWWSKIREFCSKYTLVSLILVALMITALWGGGFKLNPKKMIYTFALNKGIPLESTKKAVELYQVSIPGEDRKLTKDGNKAKIRVGIKEKLYFGLKNVKENNASYKLPILEIQFPEESMGNKIIIENKDVKAQRWLQMEPSGRYVRERGGALPPQIIATVLPLFVKCEKGEHKVEYIISGYDEPPIVGEFTLVAE